MLSAPKVDGIEDKIWDSVPNATAFVQFTPDNGKAPNYKTIVKLGYTNKAIYIFAILFQKPKDIFDYLSPRDKTGQADWFGFFVDAFNTGQMAYAFIVTAAGVQVDKKIIGTNEDYNWDAVWKSAVKKTSFGWTVEIKIPFNQLRFPRKKQQVWSINFLRNIQKTREIDSWNPMDIKQDDIVSQFGKLYGIKNIKQLPRIDFYPYASYYLEKNTNNSAWARYYNGGMDLKFGLNRSFTVDMMLVPDFGEVMSDEPVLNLTPFETYYMERRQFFTEGTEIFNIGGIFYSRRIGGTPSKRNDVPQQLGPNEIIEANPLEVRVLNATKLTGKTENKLGIGLLNAITANTYATVLDTITDKERKILTDYQTNYNVFALRKDLPNSSYIGFINTNKFSWSPSHYTANVSAVETAIRDKSNTYRLFFRTAASAKFTRYLEKPDLGYMYTFGLAKIKGNFKFSYVRNLYSDSYDPNDLGYLRTNNIINNNLTLGYYIYRPVWIIRNWTIKATAIHQSLYRPLRYIGTQIKIDFYGTLKNLTSAGMRLSYTPDKVYNYFEPRVENFVYIELPRQNYMFWISTDYSKKIAIDLQTGFYYPIKYKSPQQGGWLLIAPRFRLGNKLLITYSIKYSSDLNNYGYVGATASQDSVFFGKRNIRTLENILSTNFAFGPRSYLTMRVRHYWSVVNYSDYFALLRDGTLVPLGLAYHFLDNQDRNFNAFNIDMIYRWQFLPGSELSIVYKKMLISETQKIIPDYFENFLTFYNHTPGLETLIFKLVIYI